jgi:sterol-4alpha-carboxylate 3-dehydrogenase (decarboxylating)
MEGPVVVTEGAGFFGYRLIKARVQEPGCRPIVSINRNPKVNLHEDVDYRAGSITDEDFVRDLMNDTKARIVFHVASPSPESDWAAARTSGVGGTRILLKVAAQCPSVKAFVYTSSVGVVAGMLHRNVDESAPTRKPNARCNP